MEEELDLYSEAARILKEANAKKACLKTLIYNSRYKNIRQLFALVNESVRYQAVLKEVLAKCPSSMLDHELIGANTNRVVVMLFEFLLGRKFGKNVPLRRAFLLHKNVIKSAVEQVLKMHGAKSLQGAVKGLHSDNCSKIPRYMRVNLIKSSVQSVQEYLDAEGWEFVGTFAADSFQESALELTENQFGLDPHLPDLLIFAVGTDLHEHHLTKTGVLIQQDRASCVPAHVLSPPSGSIVLDCCAAPGNKATHIASLMGNKGQVIALDRDTKRLSTMVRMLAQSEASCVEPIHQDFLTVDPSSSDAEHVQMVLVDPSCSGSGMLNAGSDSHNTDRHRLETLKRFQITLLKHALKFPGVQRLVYSTCSVHPEENEQVVEEVMAQVSSKFEFDPVFPKWKSSRGLPGFPNAGCFLRLSPQQDLTQGFFVACFKRVAGKSPASVMPCSETISQVSDRSVSSMHSCVKPYKTSESSNNMECAEMGKMQQSKKKTDSRHCCEDIGEEEASGGTLTSVTAHTLSCVSSGTKKLKVKTALPGKVQNAAVQLEASEEEVTTTVVSTAMASSFRKRKKKAGKMMLSGIECVQLEGERDHEKETRMGVTSEPDDNGDVSPRSKKRKKSSSGKGKNIQVQDEDTDKQTVFHKVSKTSCFVNEVINKAVTLKSKKKKKVKKLDKCDLLNMNDTDIRAQCGTSSSEDRKSNTSRTHGLPEKSVDLSVSPKRKKKHHRDQAVVDDSPQVKPSTGEYLMENVNVGVIASAVDDVEKTKYLENVDNKPQSERKKKKKKRKKDHKD